MTRRISMAAALIALVLAFSGIAGALDGDSPASTGWWSQDPTAAEQPEGGFQIAGLANEPVSVAAVRFSTPSGVTSARLTLQESGGFVTPATTLQVCRTTDPWEPANPGAYADAPTPDCAAPAPLTRDADALVWSAEVASLLPTVGGEISLMIVPGETPEGGSPLDPGFQVTFSAAALAVTSAPGTTVGSGTTPTTFFSPPPSGGGGGSTFTPPGPATSPTTMAPTTPDTAPADDATAGGDAFRAPTFAAGATPGGGADQPWERLLILVPLSAVLGLAVVYGGRVLRQRGVLEEA